MTLITKPDFTYVWASGGAIVAPNDTKKQLGWIAEAPPFQYDNWLQNRQDQMLAHINQRGIPAWDGLTNYEAGGLSYVQGSDGKVYKSVAASGPSATVQNPTTDGTDTYWTIAFADVGAFLTQTAGDTRYTQRSNNLSDVTNVATARTNLGAAPLASPAFTGTPTAPTASVGTNTTQLATTAFVQASTPLNLKTSGIAGTFSNLKASATGTNATVTVTADSICLKNSSNEQVVLDAVSVAPSLAASGANGLDTGASAINTWYYVWVIWNGAAAAGLLSLSSSAPTMPNGYTHKAMIGAIRTDATANKFPLGFTQLDKSVSPKIAAGANVTTLPTLASGIAGALGGAPTWVAIALGAFVPPIARKIRLSLANTSTTVAGTAIAAPNNSYGGVSAGVVPPPLVMSNNGSAPVSIMGELLLESTSIYWASNGASNGLFLCGYEL